MKCFINNQLNCQVCKEGCIHIKIRYVVHLIPGHKNAMVQRACEDVAVWEWLWGIPWHLFISDSTMARCVAEKLTLERALWCPRHGHLGACGWGWYKSLSCWEYCPCVSMSEHAELSDKLFREARARGALCGCPPENTHHRQCTYGKVVELKTNGYH